jgi:penicillin-binding protein 1B
MSSRLPARPSPRPAIRGGLIERLGPVRRRQLKLLLRALAVVAGICLVIAAGFWIHYARLIDARLAGEERPVPRIFGRPFEIRAGTPITPTQLEQRLNDVGYAKRPKAEAPGEFAVAATAVTIVARPVAGVPERPLRVEFAKGNARVAKILDAANKPVEEITLEAPLLTALAPGAKQRKVAFASIPQVVKDAVMAIEDRRFFEHPGVDPIRAVGAVLTNLRGDKPYLVGGSTITQQIVKNMFLTPDKTLRRKLQEQFMALVLESRYTKEQILELYLNTVTLGQRGPFEIHGVAEAARIFFGKDLSNVTLAEAATMAGLIQAPSRLSPFKSPERARERRNVVLQEMADNRLVPKADADKAAAEPLRVSARALEDEAPYFVDYVSQIVDDMSAGAFKVKKDAAVVVYTTLDLQLQRFAQQAIGEGIAAVDKQLAARKRAGTAQAALVAVDPRTGEILAFVGGRAYAQSQFNRAVSAHRQPGSVFKPFVYLAAFERMAQEGRADLTPATIELDEPTTFKDGENDYTPTNYQGEYDGPITLRRALALSRNVVAVRVAEQVGYDRVADLWRRVGVGAPPRPYPAIALGVFEATPLDLAAAYTLFTNGGAVRPLVSIAGLVENGRRQKVPPPDMRPVARADTTYLVTSMMRSVINEGTAAGARATFRLDAAGKTGTTNDLRDAWFIGFTPELLTVVWVGFDDNKPIGLSGAQAALPIWTAFMKNALAGHADRSFPVPPGVSFAEIDKQTGRLALPSCPSRINEAFLAGTEPRDYCDVHGGTFERVLSRIGGFFKRIIRGPREPR